MRFSGLGLRICNLFITKAGLVSKNMQVRWPIFTYPERRKPSNHPGIGPYCMILTFEVSYASENWSSLQSSPSILCDPTRHGWRALHKSPKCYNLKRELWGITIQCWCGPWDHWPGSLTHLLHPKDYKLVDTQAAIISHKTKFMESNHLIVLSIVIIISSFWFQIKEDL